MGREFGTPCGPFLIHPRQTDEQRGRKTDSERQTDRETD